MKDRKMGRKELKKGRVASFTIQQVISTKGEKMISQIIYQLDKHECQHKDEKYAMESRTTVSLT